MGWKNHGIHEVEAYFLGEIRMKVMFVGVGNEDEMVGKNDNYSQNGMKLGGTTK